MAYAIGSPLTPLAPIITGRYLATSRTLDGLRRSPRSLCSVEEMCTNHVWPVASDSNSSTSESDVVLAPLSLTIMMRVEPRCSRHYRATSSNFFCGSCGVQSYCVGHFSLVPITLSDAGFQTIQCRTRDRTRHLRECLKAQNTRDWACILCTSPADAERVWYSFMVHLEESSARVLLIFCRRPAAADGINA